MSGLNIYRIDGSKGSTVVQNINLRSSVEEGVVNNEVNLSKKIDVPIELVLPDLFSPGSTEIPIISTDSSIGASFGLPGTAGKPAPEPVTNSFFDVFINIEIKGLLLNPQYMPDPLEFPDLDKAEDTGQGSMVNTTLNRQHINSEQERQDIRQ
jgi:hypothetical protein